jgi:hypothetical protein
VALTQQRESAQVFVGTETARNAEDWRGGAAWSLWTRHGESFSLPGLIVALLTTPIMIFLARRNTNRRKG